MWLLAKGIDCWELPLTVFDFDGGPVLNAKTKYLGSSMFDGQVTRTKSILNREICLGRFEILCTTSPQHYLE